MLVTFFGSPEKLLISDKVSNNCITLLSPLSLPLLLPGQLRLPESREIVLEYIVERKRMDDLADSIIDRRFQEQKVSLEYLRYCECFVV